MGLRVVLVGVGVVASACGGVADSAGQRPGSATEPSPTPVTVDQVPPGEREDTPSALDNPTDDRFPPPVIDVGELRSGGPPPDGIPAIDEPRFLDADGVDFLDDNEPVLAVEIDGDARAYPLQIMTWHEIVNDTVGGSPWRSPLT